MISIRTNLDNPDYLVINRIDISLLLFLENVPNDIRKIANDIYADLFSFEKNQKTGYISEISIRKDSEIGEYLLNTKDIAVINEDREVTYERIVNALNIAMFEDNPIASSIFPLFKERIEGMYDELVNKYNAEVLDYILKNFDFQLYLKKKDGDYIPKDVVVYEDGAYSIRNLSTETDKQIKKEI